MKTFFVFASVLVFFAANCFAEEKKKSWLDIYLEGPPNGNDALQKSSIGAAISWNTPTALEIQKLGGAPRSSSQVAARIIPAAEVPAKFSQPTQPAHPNEGHAFQFKPTADAEDLAEFGRATSDLVTSRSLVHINGYQRGGVEVSSHYRQPPGGISTADHLKGDAAGILVVAAAVAVDYFLQQRDHQKSAVPISAKPKYPLVTSVGQNSLASQIKIESGDFLLSYNNNDLGWAEASNNPLLYNIEQAKQQSIKTTELLIYRSGNFLRAFVPAGEKLGITLSESELPQ